MPGKNQIAPIIVWFRRDLRLADNLALQAALAAGGPVVCVYIREPGDPLAGALGSAQAWWLHHSLAALGRALENRGSHLLLLTGAPHEILTRLIAETGAGSVLWNRRYDPKGVELDTEIKSRLVAAGIEARSFAGFLLHEPTRLRTKQGKPFRVFTPFWRALEAMFEPIAPLPAPDKIPSLESKPASESLSHWHLLPTKPNWADGFAAWWQPGEDGAIARLDAFVDDGIVGYRENRDRPGIDATSGLSPHLAMGEISPHRIWAASLKASQTQPDIDASFFRRELVWRDFAWHSLVHQPDMASVNLDRRFDAFEWQQAPDALAAWKVGQTGYPIVDAGMRELWQTGAMHNRVRMITASFLIKHLLIDWRIGERWFADTLVDIDPAANAMNWQWVAGSGADASPWFRIFNPIKQGETFDPEGEYVYRYCPELKGLPPRYLHKPFDAPRSVLQSAGVRLGDTYPKPLVDHDWARHRALAAFTALPKSQAS
jgi:deoxyribodipyrimidine photo-lyase